MFQSGEEVVHEKGGRYVILKAPDGRRLVYCGEQFYEYVALKDNSIWIRRQSEMEDGRFSGTVKTMVDDALSERGGQETIKE
jgi:hypothetical protein